MAEYIWIGSSGADLKSRTVVLDEKPSSPDELPIAEIDGSTYGQATEDHCEIYLQPKKIFPDPFRGGDHILVLCDIYVPPIVSCNTTHFVVIAQNAFH
jgi:glutamine synthetase